jgi:hypothetical protein
MKLYVLKTTTVYSIAQWRAELRKRAARKRPKGAQ